MGISGKTTAGGNPVSAAASLFAHLYNFLDQNSLDSIWKIFMFSRFQSLSHTHTQTQRLRLKRKKSLSVLGMDTARQNKINTHIHKSCPDKDTHPEWR